MYLSNYLFFHICFNRFSLLFVNKMYGHRCRSFRSGIVNLNDRNKNTLKL